MVGAAVGGLQGELAGAAVAGDMDDVPPVAFFEDIAEAVAGDAILEHLDLGSAAGGGDRIDQGAVRD